MDATIKASPIRNVEGLKRYLSVLSDEQLLDVEINLIDTPDLSECVQHKLNGENRRWHEYESAEQMLSAIVQWFATRSTGNDDMILQKGYQNKLIADIISLCDKHSIVIDDYKN